MENKVIIVGGGASGLMASLVASDNGANVTLIERNNRIGKKLLATGNGRCNYGNIYGTIENYHGSNNKFPYSVLAQLDVYSTMDYFERLGISPKIEDEGKVFPASLQSSSFLDVFTYEIQKRKINLILEEKVLSIKKDGVFTVKTDKNIYKANKVIIATGGKSLGKSGSDGSGYDLLTKLGHKITDLFPGIVQLNLDGAYLKEKSGVRINSTAGLVIDDILVREETGDILFTDYGISGPTILQLSRTALANLRANKKVEIAIKVIPNSQEDSLIDYLINRFAILGDKPLADSLIGLINKKLIGPIIKTLGLDKNKPVAEVSKEEIISLARILSSWKFRVIGSQPWEFAQVTAGGVDTSEVHNKTLESKLVPGLYIIGEVLDVDGDCGGHNLQWAWSSAYVAANQVLK